jgi:hypothetical protein
LIVPVRAWQNPYQPLDVFPDGFISGLDALLIINEINKPGGGSTPLDPTPVPPNVPPAYLDVDGDGFVSATDAILVINELNHPTLGSPFIVLSEAVPEAAAAVAAPAAVAPAASAPVASAADVSAAIASEPIDVMAATPVPAIAAATPKLTDLAMTVYDNLDSSLLAIDAARLTAATRPDALGDVVREITAAAAPVVGRRADRAGSVAREWLDSSDGALAGLAHLFAAHADDDSVLACGRAALGQERGELAGLLAKRRRS